jgi:hypothetical protein
MSLTRTGFPSLDLLFYLMCNVTDTNQLTSTRNWQLRPPDLDFNQVHIDLLSMNILADKYDLPLCFCFMHFVQRTDNNQNVNKAAQNVEYFITTNSLLLESCRVSDKF